MKKKRHMLKLTLQIFALIVMTGCTISYEGCGAADEAESDVQQAMRENLEIIQKDEEQGRVAQKVIWF